jgi:predicted N-formylglutamate amidohydrolase
VARSLARALRAPLLAATSTRLLVDPNRSPHNPAVFSELTRGLPRAERQALLARHHRPHWSRVRAAIARRPGATLHVAVHSFTPVLGGEVRNADVGLLYDSQRPSEVRACRRWQAALAEIDPSLRVRRNYPYRGAADGLATWLRRRLPDARYAGVELELNQALLAGPSRAQVTETLARSLVELIGR